MKMIWQGRRSRWSLASVGAVAAMLMVTSACGGGDSSSDSTPGVTDDTIVLGTTQPLTGAAAPAYKMISDAMTAYFEYVNDNGGVHGRKIEFIVEDDAYDPSKTVEKTRKLIQQDKVFAIVASLGTPTHTAVLDFLRQNKVPDLFPSSGSTSWNQPDKYPYTFGWQPDYIQEGKILAHFVKEEHPDLTPCFFGQGDDQGTDGKKGVELVLGEGALKHTETYTVSNTNVSPQIGKLQAEGCEVVYSFSLAGFNALALEAANKLGYKPLWVTGSGGADVASLTSYLKGNAAPLEGMLTNSYLPVDPENSWIKLFQEINADYNDDAAFTLTLLYGYAKGFTVVQALHEAGEDLTREGLVEAMMTADFEGPGLLPATYAKGDHSGYGGSAVSRIEDGVPSIVSPVFTTDSADGPVEPSTAEPVEATADGLPK